MKLLVDTNICIHFLDGDAQVREKWLAHSPAELGICSVVKAELYFGARHSAQAADNLRRLDIFFAPLTSLPFDDAAAQSYGTLRAELRRNGTPVGGNDMQIAAIALANRLTLVTRNTTELARIPGLQLARW